MFDAQKFAQNRKSKSYITLHKNCKTCTRNTGRLSLGDWLGQRLLRISIKSKQIENFSKLDFTKTKNLFFKGCQENEKTGHRMGK